MDKIKVLVLGATGMAGHVVYFYLQSTGKYKMTNAVFRSKLTDDSIVLDVTDFRAVENMLRMEKPDVVVNCVVV